MVILNRGFYVPVIYMIPAFLIALCSAIGLKFNVDERQHESFPTSNACHAFVRSNAATIVLTNPFGLAMVVVNKSLLYFW
jgi:hypothetical protein